ncbi:hypothetical protein BL250_13505 [Erwinia sp. OLTSP20]|uniref:hypothetical protein n=1 Tax=unclassified Erwinia TaxID=2622719 RepID=UPI000C17B705|nr:MULTISPECIES: hypothetical protein [unclassified Erwinia]PIJ48538.1 hypothetical protein BV501_16780 [Erwinia sp. OAMSP11]PIJ69163.1 hypothetical protein BK416_15450 [Erwinia sp. OLSSP12]PIJ78800.1 hypothetical protein BLD47_16730 [Erwinia sp. OLCASP19]PIJ81842.1 hypothetical protein BLD46_12135 [Erwinia sp. OLMTSP26]PIJ82119.1 hypothetical protein BLD49_15760 [Erwinia sp. OLMDSP33]
MKERPILFNDQRVAALKSGMQTQTRRIMKALPLTPAQDNHAGCYGIDVQRNQLQANRVRAMGELRYHCPYGQPGDRLWVRESWRGPLVPDHQMAAWQASPDAFRQPEYCQYRADSNQFGNNEAELTSIGWQAAIHMPRWASRINLEITGIRVEKIQYISEQDIVAEGVQSENHFLNNFFTLHHETRSPKEAYRDQWAQQYGAASWEVNPWVWVIDFKRV